MILVYLVGGSFSPASPLLRAVFVLPLGPRFRYLQIRTMAGAPADPTRNIFAATEHSLVAAGFPETDAFAEALAQRLIEAWESHLPSRDIFDRMMEIAAAL